MVDTFFIMNCTESNTRNRTAVGRKNINFISHIVVVIVERMVFSARLERAHHFCIQFSYKFRVYVMTPAELLAPKCIQNYSTFFLWVLLAPLQTKRHTNTLVDF